VDRLGLVILEHIFYSPKRKSSIIGKLGLQETISVACWYILWQRCEKVKCNQISSPTCDAFAISAPTSNFGTVTHKSKEKEVL
jgi:hypothetical protein